MNANEFLPLQGESERQRRSRVQGLIDLEYNKGMQLIAQCKRETIELKQRINNAQDEVKGKGLVEHLKLFYRLNFTSEYRHKY